MALQPSPLLDISEFQTSFVSYLESLKEEEKRQGIDKIDLSSIDINVDSLKLGTAFEQIEGAIQKEMESAKTKYDEYMAQWKEEERLRKNAHQRERKKAKKAASEQSSQQSSPVLSAPPTDDTQPTLSATALEKMPAQPPMETESTAAASSVASGEGGGAESPKSGKTVKKSGRKDHASFVHRFVDFANIPTLASIQEQQGTLLSLTEEGKKENSARLKRREPNFITTYMQGVERPAGFSQVEQSEIVLTVALFHAEKPQKVQEFRVLGSQLLTDLRDSFYCLADHILDGPTTRSAYFFIENVFYNDMRDENAIDYSEPIIAWSQEPDRVLANGLGPFSAKNMDDVTFGELSIRLNNMYIYGHQGNCEHYFCFTDVRFVHDQDEQNDNLYPLHTYQARVRRRKCRICSIYPAKFVTHGDRLSPETPCFFCDYCYRLMHYNQDGELLYDDFEVYRYYHE